MSDKNSNHHDYLIRGSDYLAQHTDFKLVGREAEMKKLSGILMRDKANSVLLVGPGGVGATALCMGLQASKDDPNAPFDVVSKRLFWLDVDNLFSSGDPAQINDGFQKMLNTLYRTPDSVLIIEDTKDFIEAARNNGCTHFVNALTLAVRNEKTQIILETRDEDLDTVLKWHSDVRESYTMMEVDEPTGDALNAIVTEGAKRLEKHHGIKIAPEAISASIEMTNKYRTRDMGLSRAQPERSMTLLDRALTSYRLNAHQSDPALTEMQWQYNEVNAALTEGKEVPQLKGMGKEELETLLASLGSDITETKEKWAADRSEIKTLYKTLRSGEEAILSLEAQIVDQRKLEEEARARATKGGGAEAVETDAVEAPPPARGKITSFASITSKGGFDSDVIRGYKGDIARFQSEIDKARTRFDALTGAINEKLLLEREQVLGEFANISGIPATKLNQDEREKLRGLHKNLGERVFGQDDAVERLSNAVITARISAKQTGKPQASFLFMGPSGVGKTEIAKALAAALLDDENTLTRFDMSEYMEKHAVAKLIGAPPGYEGFEAGGILTNAMRKNPSRILLFDEIEKAHPDVFNIFLQILSDGRLTDNVGRTVSFADSIILMTSNVGKEHFVDPNLSFEEAKVKALAELDTKYPTELLNRFSGRENIVCFNRLELDSIEKIVRREIKKVDKLYGEQGINILMTDEELKKFCEDRYNPIIGARGLPGFIEANLEPRIARTLLHSPETKGTMYVTYNKGTKAFDISAPVPLAAEQNNTPQEKAKGALAAEFKHA